jgi:xanthine dehydrogenase accessory factor
MLVTADDIEGTLGTSALDVNAASVARDAIQTEKSGLVTLASDVDVYVDVFPLPPLMVLIGAVHVAQAIVKYASPLGFRIVVVDARQTLAKSDSLMSTS